MPTGALPTLLLGVGMESLQFLSVMLSVLSVVAAALMMLAMTLDGRNLSGRPGDSVNELAADEPSPLPRQESSEGNMAKTISIVAIALVSLIAACDRPMSTGEKGAAVGAAAGTGIGLVTGGSFGQVVGAGLIGGAVGYLGGSAIGDK